MSSLHAYDLTGGKHDHHAVIHIVHVIHEHIPVWTISAGHVGECGCPEVVVLLRRRIGDKVVARTIVLVAPNVMEIEPMADLMGGCPAKIGRRPRGASRSERGIVDRDAVGVGSARAGKLRVTIQGADVWVDDFRADPNIQISGGVPGIMPALGRELHLVVGGEARDSRLRASDPGCRIPVGVDASHFELDPNVAGKRLEDRRRVGRIGIRHAIIAIEHVNLAGDLCIGNILRRRSVDHMHDHRNGRNSSPCRNAAATREFAGVGVDGYA